MQQCCRLCHQCVCSIGNVSRGLNTHDDTLHMTHTVTSSRGRALDGTWVGHVQTQTSIYHDDRDRRVCRGEEKQAFRNEKRCFLPSRSGVMWTRPGVGMMNTSTQCCLIGAISGWW